MNNGRWRYFAAIASIIALLLLVAYFAERECQRDLAFERSFPPALSELVLGKEPIKCWFR
jgi:hypothetical protein